MVKSKIRHLPNMFEPCRSARLRRPCRRRQDYSVVSGQLSQLLAETVGQRSDAWTEYVLRDPVLFGDYRSALEADVPRLYEDIQDYDAAKALFQEVRK